jgi:hypothetical protein
MRWTFEMRRDSIATLQLRYEWALQRQNRRFADAWPSAGMAMRKRQILVISVSLFGLVLTTSTDVGLPTFWLFGKIFFGCALVAGVFLPSIRARLVRFSGRVLAKTAVRTYTAVAKRAPYTIDYELDGSIVTARAEAIGISRRIDLAKAALILCADQVLFVFKRLHATGPSNLIYVPAELHADVLDALDRLGVRRETVDAPVAGYVPPIPEARAT